MTVIISLKSILIQVIVNVFCCRMTKNMDTDFYIDITEDVCPMTFVKTKLLIERMEVGQILEIRLSGREPLENVPRNVKDHGHEILSIQRESGELIEFGVHRLIVKKN